MSDQLDLCFDAGIPLEGTKKRAIYEACDREWRTSWGIQARLPRDTYASESTVTARLREMRSAGLVESRSLPGQRHVEWRRA